MGYSKEIYESALHTITQRRIKAISDCEERCSRLYEKYPRLEQIKHEMARASIEVARAVLSKKDVKDKVLRLKESNLSLQAEMNEILHSAGFSIDYLEPKFYCKDCSDQGFIDGKMCTCLKELMRCKAYEQLNSLSCLSLCDFDGFDLNYYSDKRDEQTGIVPRDRMRDIFNYCKSYAQDFGPHSPSLLMRGGTGLGKTHLSLAIAKSAIQRGYGVIYGSMQTLVSRLEHERFSRTFEGNGDSLSALCSCDLLVLDDLGAEFPTSFVVAVFNEIVNSRMMSKRPTIISTNLSSEEFLSRYSARIASRIIGFYHTLSFVGRDIRQIKKYK